MAEGETIIKGKIEQKIGSIVEYILAKPESAITWEDYEILASELLDIRFREQQAEQSERTVKLMATALSGTMCGVSEK